MTGTEPHASETGLMGDITYVGLDVHKATISIALAEGGRGGGGASVRGPLITGQEVPHRGPVARGAQHSRIIKIVM
jgi:hypothetical protein